MTDIKLALEEAFRQGLATYQWWIFVLAIVGSGIGTFFCGYLKSKGEHKATNEHFQAIRSQLQTATQDTEQIKHYLSSKAWRRQQQWAAQEQHYRKLLNELHAFKSALATLKEYYMEPGSEHTPDSAFGERFKDLLGRASKAYRGVGKSLGTAAP